MRERIIIVFIAIFIGLLVTTLVYFLYQQTKSIPSKTTNISRDNNPTPTPANSVFLAIATPNDEALSDRRDIQVKGKTNAENTIIISTNQADIVVKPTSDGAFSASVTIDAGANKIITRAIAPNGDSTEDVRVVTFTTEDF